MVVDVETDLETRSQPATRQQMRDWLEKGFSGKNDLWFQKCDPMRLKTLEKVIRKAGGQKKRRCRKLKCTWRPASEYEVKNGKLGDFRKSYVPSASFSVGAEDRAAHVRARM